MKNKLLNFIIFLFIFLKGLVTFIFFFIRLDRFFFLLGRYLVTIRSPIKDFVISFRSIINLLLKNNNKFFQILDRFSKSELIVNKLNFEIFDLLANQDFLKLDKNENVKVFTSLKKKNFISYFNTHILNNLIFDLESHELNSFTNSYDLYEITYNNILFVKNTLFNYSLFQSRILTNESILFDNFFYQLKNINDKRTELDFYQFFVLNYSTLYIGSDYNTQIIHSKDMMSFNNFFSINYYDYFKIQQEQHFFLNPVNILDDFRCFSTIIQLNNNLLTNNFENYMINIQKLIFVEEDIFYNSKVTYVNNKYIFLFYFNLLTFNTVASINAVSLFEQTSLMFSESKLNSFFAKLLNKNKFIYSFWYFSFFLCGLLIFFFFLQNSIYDFFFFVFILSSFLFFFLLNRFLVNFEITLFGYSKKKTIKLFYEKLYLSDYKVTQYDDIFYYQQKYILERDFEQRKLSNLIIDLDKQSNFEDIIYNAGGAYFFDNNLPELIFLNMYELLYDFESDWKDHKLEDLRRFDLDRFELTHGYPFEWFLYKISEKNLNIDLQKALNTEDLMDLYEMLDDIVDRADSTEGLYDLLTDDELDDIDFYLDDLAEFFDEFELDDLKLFNMFSLSGGEFTFTEQKKVNVEVDTDAILNYDIPDSITENVEEEFIEPENNIFSKSQDVFISTQKKIQKKIFKTIYFELLEEKKFLIEKYGLQFLLRNFKYSDSQLIKLQTLLQEGRLPFWIFNTNNFYKEVKIRIYNWQQQLLSAKKIYNDFSLALLNLEEYYGDAHPRFYNEYRYEFRPDARLLNYVSNFLPPLLIDTKDPYYDGRGLLLNHKFSSSIFAYTDVLSGYFFISSFIDDQSLVDVLEHTNFNDVLKKKENIPIQLDFFQSNSIVMTELLNTLNSNLYLLFCNNINLNDYILKNQLLIFQHYLEYTVLKIENLQGFQNQIKIFFNLIRFAKFNTIYDLELFFFNYLLKYFKIINIMNFFNSHLLLLNLVNYYINKYNLYQIRLPTNLLELNRFYLKLKQYEIYIGLEAFDSNNFIENQEILYERTYNMIPYNVYDNKDYMDYEEMDSFILTEFFDNPEYSTQFVYNNIIYTERSLYTEDEVVDGDITKLPPYLTYTLFNNLTSTAELAVPSITQNKYIFSDYFYSTIFTEVSDDMFDFDGFFL